MFKKLSVITTLSATLLIGSAFTNTVDASESTNYSQYQQYEYKVYYSSNENWYTNTNVDGFLKNFFTNYQVNWNDQNSTDKPAEPVKEDQDQEQTKQQTQKQEVPDQVEPKEAPVQEAPVQQQPTKHQEPQTQSEQLSQYEQQVVELTNAERVERGLNPLKIDLELSRVAREKSRDMSANNYFSHTSPTYGSPFDMMKSYGITYRSAGENIAKGQRTPEEVVNGWMNSEGHRANILSTKFTHIGVGYISDGNYWTQQFIGK
ncbi:CAP domain-containing protein [Virgibacillus sp. DJP39]|uniref:CAP domain-containing protein n=1 Tax=Virgibacillus sp. DJP39 TaxID=3409790 RepID=UPI003BB5782F